MDSGLTEHRQHTHTYTQTHNTYPAIVYSFRVIISHSKNYVEMNDNGGWRWEQMEPRGWEVCRRYGFAPENDDLNGKTFILRSNAKNLGGYMCVK